MSRNFFNNFRPIARDRTRDRLVVYIGTGLNLSKKLLVSEPLGTILLSLMHGTDKVRDTEKQRSFCRAEKKNGWPVPWVDYRLSYRNFATIFEKIDGKFVPPLPPPPPKSSYSVQDCTFVYWENPISVCYYSSGFGKPRLDNSVKT